VDSANGEKQAIWTRHATMLVGNSLIIAGVRADGSNLDTGTTIFLNGLGLLLCLVWAVMNWSGWGWFHKALADGSRVPVDPLLNPLSSTNHIAVLLILFSFVQCWWSSFLLLEINQTAFVGVPLPFFFSVRCCRSFFPVCHCPIRHSERSEAIQTASAIASPENQCELRAGLLRRFRER
jgi:hypothetical protein